MNIELKVIVLFLDYIVNYNAKKLFLRIFFYLIISVFLSEHQSKLSLLFE
jgi:hypothetical protein